MSYFYSNIMDLIKLKINFKYVSGRFAHEIRFEPEMAIYINGEEKSIIDLMPPFKDFNTLLPFDIKNSSALNYAEIPNDYFIYGFQLISKHDMLNSSISYEADCIDCTSIKEYNKLLIELCKKGLLSENTKNYEFIKMLSKSDDKELKNKNDTTVEMHLCKDCVRDIDFESFDKKYCNFNIKVCDKNDCDNYIINKFGVDYFNRMIEERKKR